MISCHQEDDTRSRSGRIRNSVWYLTSLEAVGNPYSEMDIGSKKLASFVLLFASLQNPQVV